METKKGFILAAGHGTRMGSIGKKLPKILWPIFEKSILELQVLYLQELGVEDIFINTHHLSHKIKDFIKKKNLNVTILHEEKLLGTGGCFHHFKKKIGNAKILAINGDQFYFSSCLKNWHDLKTTTLFGVTVSSKHYRKLETKEGLLTSITNSDLKGPFITFSGVSVVDLKTLQHREGSGHYFSHVANYQKEKILVKHHSDTVYYDFGSLTKYTSSLHYLLKQYTKGVDDPFTEFLSKHHAINTAKLTGLSYDSPYTAEEIVLGKDFSISKNSIRYRDIVESF